MRPGVRAEYRRAASQHWCFRARREIFARVLDGAGRLPPNARILDVGPGFGVNLPVLRGRGRVAVLDLDRDSLDACRAAGIEEAVYGDVHDLPFRDGAFDLVTALDVLEHLDHDVDALGGIRRVLCPGGRLLVSVPAFALLWGRQDVLSDHRRRYRRAELERKLTEAGFVIRRLSYFNTVLFLPILAVRLAMRPFLTRSVERGRSDLAVRFPPGIEAVLYRAFAAESRWLTRHDLPFGVSLLALAVREDA